ncbi:unnamed protein product, partial [Mesorhabditis spiculigera]
MPHSFREIALLGQNMDKQELIHSNNHSAFEFLESTSSEFLVEPGGRHEVLEWWEWNRMPLPPEFEGYTESEMRRAFDAVPKEVDLAPNVENYRQRMQQLDSNVDGDGRGMTEAGRRRKDEYDAGLPGNWEASRNIKLR